MHTLATERCQASENLHQDHLGTGFRIQRVAQDGQGDALHPSVEVVHQLPLSARIAGGGSTYQCDRVVVVADAHVAFLV